MNEPKKKLNAEQSALVSEIVEAYGIEPEDVLFYDDEPKPFLMYEALAVLCNYLANISGIDVEPVPSVSDDSVAVRCTLTLSDGRVRSAVGVANCDEKIDNKKASNQQLYNLAASRALRSALRSSGIDIIKRHIAAKEGKDVLGFKMKSNYDSLLAQANILGKAKRLKNGDDKTLWYHELWSRYQVSSSNQLTETELADFVAFLNAYKPPTVAAQTA